MLNLSMNTISSCKPVRTSRDHANPHTVACKDDEAAIIPMLQVAEHLPNPNARKVLLPHRTSKSNLSKEVPSTPRTSSHWSCAEPPGCPPKDPFAAALAAHPCPHCPCWTSGAACHNMSQPWVAVLDTSLNPPPSTLRATIRTLALLAFPHEEALLCKRPTCIKLLLVRPAPDFFKFGKSTLRSFVWLFSESEHPQPRGSS